MSDSLVAQVRIPGRARTKGSMQPFINSRTKKLDMREDHKHSKPWREHIVRSIRRQIWPDPNVRPLPFAGPVDVRLTFLCPRLGPSAELLAYPTLNAGLNANGDLDKFERNVLDALKDASVLADDCIVVGLRSWKLWAPPGQEELQIVVLRAPEIHAQPRGCRECQWVDWHALGCPASFS